jgi:hypothetical protein
LQTNRFDANSRTEIRLGSPVVFEALLATAFALAVALASATATAAIATATATAAEATAAIATAATAAEAATTAAAEAATAAAAATTEAATGGTRSARLSLVHHEGAALKVLAVEAFDRGLAGFLGTHGHEAESTRTTRLAIRTNEDIQHFPVRCKHFAEGIWRRTIVEVSDKDLEHVWPPRPVRATKRNRGQLEFSTRRGLTVSGAVNEQHTGNPGRDARATPEFPFR